MQGYNDSMAEPTDLENLARRFLDLWQEQLAGMAADPEFAASAERILTTFNTNEKEGAARDDTADSGATDRPPTAGDASGDGDDGLRSIERRLAALEERIAALETGTGRRGE